MISLFNRFFETIEFDHQFSFSFITLVPKVTSLSNLNDFRPFSLLGWVHKLITYVPAARLEGGIGKLVRDTQSSFIKGRNIFEGWMMSSEMLDEMKRVGNCIVFKIDFEKTYDNVD